MKIRTITLGIPGNPTPEIVSWASHQLVSIADFFISRKYTVQTRRIALGHWDTGLGIMPEAQRTSILKAINAICIENKIDFCSVGMIRVPAQIEYIATMLKDTPRLSASAEGSHIERGIDRLAIHAAANAILNLAWNSSDGVGNFQFGTGFCLRPGIPFFPGSYHAEDQPSFTIGFENSDILVDAFGVSRDLETARTKLYDLLTEKYRLVEESALELSKA